MDESSKKQMSLLWAIGVILVFLGLVINFFFESFFKEYPISLLILLFIINFLIVSLIVKRIKLGEIDRGYFKPPIVRAINPGDFWFHTILLIGAEIMFFVLFLIFLIFYLLSIFS